jgi:hypothetical protein
MAIASLTARQARLVVMEEGARRSVFIHVFRFDLGRDVQTHPYRFILFGMRTSRRGFLFCRSNNFISIF